MNSINVDQVVKYVKSIADNTLCDSCGELKGDRVRYPCGHSVCDNCVLTDENCVVCLSPQDVSTHVNDGPLSLRVKHASNLLHTFQELYKVDVYRRFRVSKQLQLEKQLFPECIQAPSKYFNSKRISIISIKNKENITPTVLPGENTSESDILEMENKMNYVQQWLNKNKTNLSEANYNLPRKPFTDLNVNGQKSTILKTPNKVTKKKKKLSTNKSHIKTFNSEHIDKGKLSLLKIRKDVEKKMGDEAANCKQIECEIKESENDILIISDTPSVDKDRNAWLAVIEAEKQNPYDDLSIPKVFPNQNEKVVNTNNLDIPIQCQNVDKVPFYKKSSLYKMNFFSYQYNKSTSKSKIIQNTSKNNNVTITIDNSTFVTTVKFSEVQDSSRDRTKYSIGVQTEDRNNFNDFSKIVELPVNKNSNFIENHQIPTLGLSKNIDTESAHQGKEIDAMETNQKQTHLFVKQPKCLLIDDSDSDSDIWPTEKDSLLEVTAEVHRSETDNDCSVFSQLEQGEYEHRTRHAVREHTPGSTDSSDKENYDPNRAKRQKLDGKCCSKKY